MQQMAPSQKELGIILRDLRKKQGLPQTELGRRVGLDQKKVSLIENGTPMSDWTLFSGYSLRVDMVWHFKRR